MVRDFHRDTSYDYSIVRKGNELAHVPLSLFGTQPLCNFKKYILSCCV